VNSASRQLADREPRDDECATRTFDVVSSVSTPVAIGRRRAGVGRDAQVFSALRGCM
jgi:hypothetical protein